MTLDVTIGKIVLKQETENGRAYPYVEQCPKANFDVCDPKATLWSREAYRSGSTGFWGFWRKNDLLSAIYEEMRYYPNSNDRDVTFLKKYAKDISNLSEGTFSDYNDKDRLKWLKYWVKKAIELYGEEAGISFT